MEIHPWKGIRFHPEATEDPGRAISPPYDVIDDETRERLYDRSPWNIVRIIQGRREEGDDDGHNVYTRARDTFRDWLDKGALLEEEAPALYVYRQDFTLEGRDYRRLGLIALLDLEDFGKGVMAHEKTLSGPKKDRLELTRATGAQFGNIFMLYDEAEKRVDALLAGAVETPSLLEYTDGDGVTHALHAIRDPDRIEEARSALRGRPGLIADGHHRYETALNFARENPEVEAAQRVMVTLVNMRDEGLLILPTHRLVKNVEGFSVQTLLGRLEADFQVQAFASEDGVPGQVRAALAECQRNHVPCFAMAVGGGKFYLLTLKDPSRTEGLGEEGRSQAWRSMDVTVLHELILKGALGIDEEALRDQTNVEYIKDIGEAVDRALADVEGGRCQALFLQNPPRMDEMRAVCEAGERMPQKSTFFHPKIYSGLVIHKML